MYVLIVATKFHNSRIISELLSSCSSLLTLFDDSLLRRSYGLATTNAVRLLLMKFNF